MFLEAIYPFGLMKPISIAAINAASMFFLTMTVTVLYGQIIASYRIAGKLKRYVLLLILYLIFWNPYSIE